MKKQLLLFIFVLLCVPLARGQATYPVSYAQGGNITSTNAACVPSACVGVGVPTPSAAVLTVGLTGTWSATLAVEESQDGGTTFTSAGTSLTSNGTTSYVVAGFTQFRVRASAFVSGNAGVSLQLSNAPSGGVTSGTADPTGNSCAANQLYVQTTSGNLYSCDAGVFAKVGGGGSGTVTSLTATLPLVATPSPITTTGAYSCPTCVVATAPGVGIAHFAGATQTVTSSAVNLAGADVTGQLPIGAVGSSGLSGTSPIAIASTGAISCPTCGTGNGTVTSASFTGGLISVATPTTTPAFTVAGTSGGIPYFSGATTWASSAAGTVNTLMKWGGAGNPPIASSITDNGTLVSTSELVNFSGAGALSTSPFLLSGTLITGGSGTTTFPYFYINQGASAPTTFDTAGTSFAINAPSGFAGTFIDFRTNGSTSLFHVSAGGSEVANGSITAGTFLRGATLTSATNCSSSGGTCGSAMAGAVSIAAAATTVTVATSAVTASSEISIQENSAMSTRLSVTCNTTIARTYAVTAITAGTSFVITSSAAPTVNPACLTFTIVN